MTRYLGPKTDNENVATQADRLNLATTNPTTITPDATAAQGSGTTAARADHTHAIVAAAPSSNLTATSTNGEGNADSFARSNHSHAITTGTPSTQFGVTNSEGSDNALARADHTHQISFPRAKGSRSTNINFTSSNNPTTVSLTTQDIAIGASVNTSLNWISPDNAGDYLISGYCEWAANATGRRELGYQINSGSSVLIATLHCSSNTVHRLNFTDLVTLAASDEVYLRALQNSGGTLALQAASISIVRVG